MNATYKLDRAQNRLFDTSGRCFDVFSRTWSAPATPSGSSEQLDTISAATWLQRESRSPVRVPVGVIGPREANSEQLCIAEALGSGLARIGIAVVCGGRQGVMEAVCRGVSTSGGLAIGLLPEADPAFANPHVGVIIATGIGEARNALIARSSLCLVVIGDSYGTLSEVALGLQFEKTVIGLEGAARIPGVLHIDSVDSALNEVARIMLSARAQT